VIGGAVTDSLQQKKAVVDLAVANHLHESAVVSGVGVLDYE
jgi:hypothetical protein